MAYNPSAISLLATPRGQRLSRVFARRRGPRFLKQTPRSAASSALALTAWRVPQVLRVDLEAKS